MFARKNKKRTEIRDIDVDFETSKRKKSQFNSAQFTNWMLGKFRFDQNGKIELLANQIRRLAKVIEKYAQRNDIYNVDYLRELVVRLVMNDKDNFISVSEFVAKFQEKLKWGVNDSDHMWIDCLLRYFEEYPHDDVLNHITAERPYLSLKLFATFTKLIKRKYQDNYDIKQEFFADYLAVRRFLLHNELVEPYLDKLEGMLQEFALRTRRHLLNERSDGKLTLPWSAKNLHKRHKILSSVLYNWASFNGFRSKTKLLQPLRRDEFMYSLTSRSILKDDAVIDGNEHGAWSHALQWFFIMEHQKSTQFLQHNPIELYENSGLLWNHIVDAFFANDFTSPEHITKTLCDSIAVERWPLLAGSVMRAHAKMHSPHFDFNEFLREKHGEEQYDHGYIMRPL